MFYAYEFYVPELNDSTLRTRPLHQANGAGTKSSWNSSGGGAAKVPIFLPRCSLLGPWQLGLIRNQLPCRSPRTPRFVVIDVRPRQKRAHPKDTGGTCTARQCESQLVTCDSPGTGPPVQGVCPIGFPDGRATTVGAVVKILAETAPWAACR